MRHPRPPAAAAASSAEISGQTKLAFETDRDNIEKKVSLDPPLLFLTLAVQTLS